MLGNVTRAGPIRQLGENACGRYIGHSPHASSFPDGGDDRIPAGNMDAGFVETNAQAMVRHRGGFRDPVFVPG
jgi:hypothetical protein